MLNLNSYKYFLAVAQDLNISSAARKLFISQQALSLQIQSLEEYYGVVLFERKPSLRLTPAGEELRKTAEAILRQNENLINTFSDTSTYHSGTIRVGISAVRASLCFPEILPKFREKWPNIKISLVDEDTDHMIGRLLNEKLDVVFAPVEDARELRRLRKNFDCTFLSRERTYLVCSDALLESCFGPRADEIRKKASEGTDLTDFSRIPYILQQPGSHMRRIADQCFQEAGFFPQVFMESERMDLIVSLYPGNYGAFFCRGSRIPQLRRNYPDVNVFPVRTGEDYVDVPLYILNIPRDPMPRHITDFINYSCNAWKRTTGT